MRGPDVNPSEEEVAAALAAIEAVWPQPAGSPAPGPVEPPARWRFSGRWWVKPVPLRRDRPSLG